MTSLSEIKFACHNGREAVLNANGSVLQKGNPLCCPTHPKPLSVKSKRKVDCNRLTCCAKQPKKYSWIGAGSLHQATAAIRACSAFRGVPRRWGQGDDQGFVAAIRHLVKYGLIRASGGVKGGAREHRDEPVKNPR